MTHREAFDKVKTHLLTQGAKAQEDCGIRCRYRSSDGLKCAVGCLIPDDQYQKKFDTGEMGLQDIQEEVPALQGLDFTFLLSLQRIHDSNPVDTWPSKLEGIESFWLTQGLL